MPLAKARLTPPQQKAGLKKPPKPTTKAEPVAAKATVKIPTKLSAGQKIWFWVEEENFFYPQTVVKELTGVTAKTKVTVTTYEDEKWSDVASSFVYETPAKRLTFVPPEPEPEEPTIEKGQSAWFWDADVEVYYPQTVAKIVGDVITFQSQVLKGAAGKWEGGADDVVWEEPTDGTISDVLVEPEPEVEAKPAKKPTVKPAAAKPPAKPAAKPAPAQATKPKLGGKKPAAEAEEGDDEKGSQVITPADRKRWKEGWTKAHKREKFQGDELGNSFLYKMVPYEVLGIDLDATAADTKGNLSCVVLKAHDSNKYRTAPAWFVRKQLDSEPA